MKKELSVLSMFVLFALCVDAQVKKTWDFHAGLSPETFGHLTADVTLQDENGKDANSNVNSCKDNIKLDVNAPLKADGASSP